MRVTSAVLNGSLLRARDMIQVLPMRRVVTLMTSEIEGLGAVVDRVARALVMRVQGQEQGRGQGGGGRDRVEGGVEVVQDLDHDAIDVTTVTTHMRTARTDTIVTRGGTREEVVPTSIQTSTQTSNPTLPSLRTPTLHSTRDHASAFVIVAASSTPSSNKLPIHPTSTPITTTHPSTPVARTSFTFMMMTTMMTSDVTRGRSSVDVMTVSRRRAAEVTLRQTITNINVPRVEGHAKDGQSREARVQKLGRFQFSSSVLSRK